MRGVRIEIENPTSGDALQLFECLDQELLTLYPAESVYSADPNDLSGDRGLLLVARLDDKPIACGAIRQIAPGIGEIKRMYVAPEWRGKGISRQILKTLEEEAIKRNLHKLKLETGIKQPAAIALYKTSQFNLIPPFGEYIGDPTSVCFEKTLAQ